MAEIQLLPTRVPNLDAVLGGGMPLYSLNIIAGPPGTGKTVLVQQLLFNHARHNPACKVIYCVTLSEPLIKVVRYMQQFTFFDADLFGDQVLYHDLGRHVREQSLPDVADYIMRLVEEHQPDIIAVDSLKAIRDLSNDAGAFRRFCYDLSVRLASARCTSFFASEYEGSELTSGAEFAVADGILYLGFSLQEGEPRRFLQLRKVRGLPSEMVPYPFAITHEGLRVYSSGLLLRQQQLDPSDPQNEGQLYAATGISGLDALLRGGMPQGYCVILAGVSGSGKTTLALQTLVYGARQGEKGLLFSFEQTPERLRRTALGFGWDFAAFEQRGLLRIVFIPQDVVNVEEHLEMMVREFEAFEPQRFVLDSFSVYLHKVEHQAIQREKTYQLATLARQTGALGLLVSDAPTSEPYRLSRYGVEETVADGTIALTAEMEGLQRRRYLEVYKMRAIDHVTGRHRMEITSQGIEVFYVNTADTTQVLIPEPLIFSPLQEIIEGDLPYGSAWLVQGEPGAGKSTLTYQFTMDGLRRKEGVLYIATDTPAKQVHQALQGFGFLPDPYMESGQFVILETSGTQRSDLDPSDAESFLFAMLRQVESMPKPLRLVFDSLTPLALGYTPKAFVALVHRKTRMLRRPDVAIFSTLLRETLERSDLYSLLNAFDVVIDLYTPDWGEVRFNGNVGYRALRVRKARGVSTSNYTFPYTISPARGMVIHKEFSKQ
ncbi:ATPase domain-containing protein [Candidatus Entotheonella palauensis]|uniref:ATPase domain-containing protein n=1 Tax=Candidatus Entotheonella palauensis TaxID=93172 RepID=UPI000B7C9BE8|nr:ATPase domain-containing protein [Candidatus Entotheonella palauensis]